MTDPSLPGRGSVAGETRPAPICGDTALDGDRTTADSDGDRTTTGSGDNAGDDGRDDRSQMQKRYWRFGAMIATSTAAMFVLMYLNTYEWDHVQWSETRFYMAFVMGATMAVIMLLFMLGMYTSRVVNAAILVAAIAENGEVTTEAELEARPVPEFEPTNGRDELSGNG